MSILDKFFESYHEKYLKKIQPLVNEINNFEPKFKSFSDKQLKEKTKEFKQVIRDNKKTLDDILPEAFALVREVSKRTLKQRHYDVQLIGGIVLHQGKIAEMKTGEGKTLAATLPVYLNALSGKGVHVVTVNDYLSRRDAVWMGQIYHFLGLSVSCLNHQQSFLYDPEYKEVDEAKDKIRDELGGFKVVEDYLRPCERNEVYQADITYGTNNEFGFDYLRDNMVFDKRQQTQRGFNYAIIDEIDSILIDEARTPLIISAPDVESSDMYKQFSRIIPNLQKEKDFELDEKLKAVTLTEDGIEHIERLLGMKDIYQEKGIKYLHHLEQALRAQILFEKDKNYVVKDGQIIIVDEFTGRLLPGRRYSGGLHQAIEAKEKVEVQPESVTLSSITFQNYFRFYKKLAGMTGTAFTSDEEFNAVYGLEVIVIPTNKPMIRKELPDKIYKTEIGKLKAVIREIKERYNKKQPVLVGTVS
ncbi:MAG TPA: preprotein translocase subunit SecA, partial [bacterium]|nr:preprotein translocase subunit SecA [bacterium]